MADRDQETAYDGVRREWDVVVDVARQPLHVRGAVAALAGRVRQWVFVSTCSVYAEDHTPGADETAALHPAWVGDGLAPDEHYGPAKVACEQQLLAVFPDALVARAGLIVGYGDRSDRFGYWPARLGDLLTACAEAVSTSPGWVQVDDDWLQEQGVGPWSGPESLPLWLPQPEYAGFMTRSTAAARAAGLTTRPVVESARAALSSTAG